MSAGDDVCPALVTCQWLNEQISSKAGDVIVIDTTFNESGPGIETYEKVHIPGARFLDVTAVSKASQFIPADIPGVEQFQEKLRALGVCRNSYLVLYESVPFWPYTGPRVWWMLRAFGHSKVSLLNGGLKKWQADGLPVSAEAPQVTPGDVTLSPDRGLMVAYDELAAIRTKGDYQVVDTRPPENFTGKEQEPSVLLQMILPVVGVKDHTKLNIQTGAMPGAKNVPYPMLYDSDLVSMRPVSQLKELFEWAGVDLSKPLLTTCYVGYTACKVAMAAHLLGNTRVPVYYGSWLEYGQRAPSDEVQLGTAPQTPPPFGVNMPGAQL